MASSCEICCPLFPSWIAGLLLFTCTLYVVCDNVDCLSFLLSKLFYSFPLGGRLHQLAIPLSEVQSLNTLFKDFTSR